MLPRVPLLLAAAVVVAVLFSGSLEHWVPDIRDRVVERPYFYGKKCKDAYIRDHRGTDPPYAAAECVASARTKKDPHRGPVCLEGADKRTVFCADESTGGEWDRALAEKTLASVQLNSNADECPNFTYGDYTKYFAQEDLCCKEFVDGKNPDRTKCVHRGLCRFRAKGRPHRGIREHNKGLCCKTSDSWPAECQTAAGPAAGTAAPSEPVKGRCNPSREGGYVYWGHGASAGLCCKYNNTDCVPPRGTAPATPAAPAAARAAPRTAAPTQGCETKGPFRVRSGEFCCTSAGASVSSAECVHQSCAKRTDEFRATGSVPGTNAGLCCLTPASSTPWCRHSAGEASRTGPYATRVHAWSEPDYAGSYASYAVGASQAALGGMSSLVVPAGHTATLNDGSGRQITFPGGSQGAAFKTLMQYPNGDGNDRWDNRPTAVSVCKRSDNKSCAGQAQTCGNAWSSPGAQYCRPA